VASEKGPYILISAYQKLYLGKYGKAITLNKFREKWAMNDVIDSVGFDKAKDLLSYYFTLEKVGHPLQFFYYNFDKMEISRNELAKDIESRRQLLEATKKMVMDGGI